MRALFSIILFHCFTINVYCIGITEIQSFGENPGNLRMYIHDNVSKDTTKKSLVIVLHGCMQSAIEAAELTGWNKLADNNNFVLIYPEQRAANNPSRCFNWFWNGDITKGNGECESIYQMILYAINHYNINTDKIFITGLSAGAALSIVMLAVHPEIFNAGASFEGGAYKIATNPFSAYWAMRGNINISRETLIENVKSQNPSYNGKYPKLIAYQGLKDKIVRPKNAEHIVSQWTGINNTDTIPDKIDVNFNNNKYITRYEYKDSIGNIIVIYYKVKKLGHELLIKPGKKYNEGGELGSYGVNRNFHSTYQTALDFGLIIGR